MGTHAQLPGSWIRLARDPSKLAVAQVQSAAMGCVASLARRTRVGHKSVVVARLFLKFCVATRRCSSRQARTSALDAAASAFAAPATMLLPMLLLRQSEGVKAAPPELKLSRHHASPQQRVSRFSPHLLLILLFFSHHHLPGWIAEGNDATES